jgi:hypothetical protein
MADVLGVQNTLVAAGGPSTILQGFINGRVKVNLDSYVLLGTEASGSTITLGATLPAGAKVIAHVIYVSAAQTSLTYSLGDGNLATRYASAANSLQTAGTYFVGGLNYVIGTATSDNQLKITTGGATATAGTLQIATLFVLD